MRLDHRRSGVAHTRPHRAGCPVAVLAVVISIYVRPVRAAGDFASPPASMPARFSLRSTNRSTASMPPTFSAGGERVALQATSCCCRGVREHAWGVPGGCGADAASMRLGLGVFSGWVRGLRSCCSVAASCGSTIVGPALLIRARIVRASLWLVSRWSFLFMCGPSGPQRHCNRRRHPCRLGSRCEPPHGRRRPAADLQRRM